MNKQRFITAAFDYDGTITPELGIPTVDLELKEVLRVMSQKAPLALCTGRLFEFIKPVIDDLCSNTPDPELARENWYIITENGASAYYYDSLNRKYYEHYRSAWAYGDKHKEEMYQAITSKLAKYIGTHENNESRVIVRTKRSENFDITDVKARTLELLALVKEIVKEFDPNKELKVVNSSIALIIINDHADKDRGVRYFAKYLKMKGFELSRDAREILCIGDSPQVDGNDEAFLFGNWGTPYTVGDINPENHKLKKVVDSKGKRLYAAEGTKYLLEKYFNLN